MENMQLYDIAGEYDSHLKPQHLENTTSFFEKMVNDSKIDIEENRKTISELKTQSTNNADNRKKLSRHNTFIRTLNFCIFAIGIILAIFFAKLLSKDSPLDNGGSVAVLCCTILVVLAIVIPIEIKRRKHSKEKSKIISDIDAQIKMLENNAYAQMLPLNKMFNYGIANELIQKTIPIIKMDRTFSYGRIKYLENEYGFKNSRGDMNRSVLWCQSGEINGNPFFFARELEHNMGSKKYTGHLTITWVESNGDKLVSRSETLKASVTKPFPMYNQSNVFYYGNEAAPDLCFSRNPNYVHQLDDKKLEKYLNKKEGKLRKVEEKAVQAGSDFTLSTNTDFEVLFNALDRNDEQQFRLLFTPLAQSNMMNLLKNNTCEIAGDTFSFIKMKKINRIDNAILQSTDMIDIPSRYMNISYDKMKEDFIHYNMDYLKSVASVFAPLFTIPLYQQQKSVSELYKNLKYMHFSSWQHETAANKLNPDDIRPEGTITNVILKTKFIKVNEDEDIISVNAMSYHAEPRVDYVSVYGGDGKYHDVPVEWDEYIRRETDFTMSVKDTEFNYKKYFDNALADENNKETKISAKLTRRTTNDSLERLLEYDRDPYVNVAIRNIVDEHKE